MNTTLLCRYTGRFTQGQCRRVYEVQRALTHFLVEDAHDTHTHTHEETPIHIIDFHLQEKQSQQIVNDCCRDGDIQNDDYITEGHY